MKKILLFLTLILLIAGCASKRNVKKAAKFEEAGLYQDAAEYYYVAVKKKASNVPKKFFPFPQCINIFFLKSFPLG